MELYKLLKAKIPELDVDPGVLSIQCNYNQKMRVHPDKINMGPSYAIAVGNYTQGKLQIYHKREAPNEATDYDIHNKILKFDGHIPHGVSHIGDGHRISFVVYRRSPRGTKPPPKGLRSYMYVLIACISRVLSDPESRWSAHEKEGLATIWSLSKLKSYLFGAKFLIETDHKNLLWLLRLSETKERGKLSRWATRNRDVFKMITMAMYQLHIHLTVNAPSTLNATGTRNYGVISILGVGITSVQYQLVTKLARASVTTF